MPELWKINYDTEWRNVPYRPPTKVSIHPDDIARRALIVFVGSSAGGPGVAQHNTDIYVCRIDGTDLRQLTHHAADDPAPYGATTAETSTSYRSVEMPTPQPTYGA